MLPELGLRKDVPDQDRHQQGDGYNIRDKRDDMLQIRLGGRGGDLEPGESMLRPVIQQVAIPDLAEIIRLVGNGLST